MIFRCLFKIFKIKIPVVSSCIMISACGDSHIKFFKNETELREALNEVYADLKSYGIEVQIPGQLKVLDFIPTAEDSKDVEKSECYINGDGCTRTRELVNICFGACKSYPCKNCIEHWAKKSQASSGGKRVSCPTCKIDISAQFVNQPPMVSIIERFNDYIVGQNLYEKLTRERLKIIIPFLTVLKKEEKDDFDYYKILINLDFEILTLLHGNLELTIATDLYSCRYFITSEAIGRFSDVSIEHAKILLAHFSKSCFFDFDQTFIESFCKLPTHFAKNILTRLPQTYEEKIKNFFKENKFFKDCLSRDNCKICNEELKCTNCTKAENSRKFVLENVEKLYALRCMSDKLKDGIFYYVIMEGKSPFLDKLIGFFGISISEKTISRKENLEVLWWLMKDFSRDSYEKKCNPTSQIQIQNCIANIYTLFSQSDDFFKELRKYVFEETCDIDNYVREKIKKYKLKSIMYANDREFKEFLISISEKYNIQLDNSFTQNIQEDYGKKKIKEA